MAPPDPARGLALARLLVCADDIASGRIVILKEPVEPPATRAVDYAS